MQLVVSLEVEVTVTTAVQVVVTPAVLRSFCLYILLFELPEAVATPSPSTASDKTASRVSLSPSDALRQQL